MALIKQMTSSGTDDWQTPLWLFRWLNDIFHFTLDAAATPENALCKKYFTKEQDALKQSWAGERVFCNPPYSRPNIYRFTEKAFQETIQECPLAVLLIPNRTATKAWNDYVFTGAAGILFISRRLHFSNAEKNAPFGSAVVLFADDHVLLRLTGLGLCDLKMDLLLGSDIECDIGYSNLRYEQEYWEGR